MNDELLNGVQDEEVTVVEKNLGITPEDVTKKSFNGMAVRLSNETIKWKTDKEIYEVAELSGISISDGNITLAVGVSQELSLSPIPELANLPFVVWESSDPSVVSVDTNTGAISTLSLGTAVISAEEPETGVKASITVTVSEENEDEEPDEEPDENEDEALENTNNNEEPGGNTNNNEVPGENEGSGENTNNNEVPGENEESGENTNNNEVPGENVEP